MNCIYIVYFILIRFNLSLYGIGLGTMYLCTTSLSTILLSQEIDFNTNFGFISELIVSIFSQSKSIALNVHRIIL